MTIYIFMFHIFVNNVRTFHDTDAVFIVLIRVYVQLNSYRETDSIPEFKVLSSSSFSITKHRTKDISCASNILQIYINQTFYLQQHRLTHNKNLACVLPQHVQYVKYTIWVYDYTNKNIIDKLLHYHIRSKFFDLAFQVLRFT